MQHYQCEDYSGIPRLGVYHVGDKNFYYKNSAMLEMSRTKKPTTWSFADDVFSAAARRPRSGLSLDKLYATRAQQLRDQYDYIVLAYSGGADSDTVLRAFVNNGIKIDEVWVDEPFEFAEKSGYVLNRSTDSTNMISEWYYTTKPTLEKLRITNPEIKIHCSDSFVDDFGDKKFENLGRLTIGMHWMGASRWTYIDQYMTKLNDRYSRVALVLGIEKFMPARQGQQIGFNLVDGPTWIKEDYIEYFYWTPDMPELCVEQAYVVWDYLKHNIKPLIDRDRAFILQANAWASRGLNMDNLIKKLIYSEWDFNKHQVDKTPTSMFNNHYSTLIDYFHKERFHQATISNVRNILSQYNDLVMLKVAENIVDYPKYRVFHAIENL